MRATWMLPHLIDLTSSFASNKEKADDDEAIGGGGGADVPSSSDLANRRGRTAAAWLSVRTLAGKLLPVPGVGPNDTVGVGGSKVDCAHTQSACAHAQFIPLFICNSLSL